MIITLPFPPAALSGHANGHWRSKNSITKEWRTLARNATITVGVGEFPPTGDIPIDFAFYPPDNRSDRTNFAARLKPAIDGIADALGVNDRRFLPSYSFHEPLKPGKVVVTIGGVR